MAVPEETKHAFTKNTKSAYRLSYGLRSPLNEQ